MGRSGEREEEKGEKRGGEGGWRLEGSREGGREKRGFLKRGPREMRALPHYL